MRVSCLIKLNIFQQINQPYLIFELGAFLLKMTTRSVLLSHAAAVELYRERYQEQQGGEIGITLNSDWVGVTVCVSVCMGACVGVGCGGTPISFLLFACLSGRASDRQRRGQ